MRFDRPSASARRCATGICHEAAYQRFAGSAAKMACGLHLYRNHRACFRRGIHAAGKRRRGALVARSPIAEVFFGGGPQGGPSGRDGPRGFSGGYGDGPKGSPGSYGDGPKGPKDGKPEGPKGPKGGWEKPEGPKGPKGGWEKPDGPKGPKGPKGPPRGWDPKEGYCPPRHDPKPEPEPEPEPISRRDVSVDNACSGEGHDKSQYWRCELLRR